MFNWRTVVGMILLAIGLINFYAVFISHAPNNLGVNPTYTKLTCIIWIAVGCLFLYRGTRRDA